jgi:hypothetical protein
MDREYKHFGLTGLEQYSLERAGYFIRRATLEAAQVEAARHCASRISAPPGAELMGHSFEVEELLVAAELPEIAGMAHDLLRPARLRSAMLHTTENREPSAWHRDFCVDPTLPPADQLSLLHGHPPAYRMRIALTPDSSLLVVPGSHADALSLEQAAALAAGAAEVPGAVCVRLELGDILVYSSALLRWEDLRAHAAGEVMELLFARNS